MFYCEFMRPAFCIEGYGYIKCNKTASFNTSTYTKKIFVAGDQ